MENEESTLEEALDNLREATQRLRATQHLMRASGMLQDLNHVDLVHRVASALAMTEAAGIEARRKLRKR